VSACSGQLTVRRFLRLTDRQPRSQCSLSSLQFVDSSLQQPTVGSIRLVQFVYHVSAATGRRPEPSLFECTVWCCPIGVGSSHVDFRHMNSGDEFRFSIWRTASFPSDASRRRSHSMFGAVVGRRYSKRAIIHGTALVCIRSLTRQRLVDFVPVRPSSV